MDLATGLIGRLLELAEQLGHPLSKLAEQLGYLLPKLAELLNEEYKLQKGVKEGIRSLKKEMKIMHAALCVVGEVPRDQLDELVKLWAGEVRELSFEMEDLVEEFLMPVDNGSEPATKSNKLKWLMKKMVGLFTKGKAYHEIAVAIKKINKQKKAALENALRNHPNRPIFDIDFELTIPHDARDDNLCS